MIIHLTLKRQYQFGMLMAVLITVALGGMNYFQTQKLSSITSNAYKNSFMVSNAIRDANLHLITMHLYMKNVVLAENNKELNAAIKNVEHHKKEFYINTQIIYERYLGNDKDIEEVIQAEKQWSLTRNKVIKLVKNGQKHQAAIIAKNKSTLDVINIESKIEHLLKFTNNKAIKLVDTSQIISHQLNSITQGFLFFIFLLGGWIVWYLYQNLDKQLSSLTKDISLLIKGHYHTEVNHKGSNEIGTFATYLEQLRLALKSTTEKVEVHHKKILNSNNKLQKETDFKNLLLDMAQAIILVLDTEGKIKVFNQYSEQMTGYSSEEVKGKDWFCLFLPDEDHEHIQKLFKQTLLKQEMTTNINSILSKDNDIISIEWHNKVLTDNNNNPTGVICVGIDVTKRIKTEALLKSSQNDLKLTLEAANLGVWNWNPQSGKLETNDIFLTMLGYTPDALPQTLERWSTLVHPNDLKPTMDILTPFLKGCDELYRSEHRMIAKDGSVKWILDVGRVTERDETGFAIQFKGVHIDITQQKETEKSLIKSQIKATAANKAKSLFLANMSHELRTPMHGILSFVNMGLNKPERLTQQKSLEFLGHIKASADRLMKLINDLLDLSKLEAGKMNMLMTQSSLMPIVQSCLNEQQARLSELNKSVIFSDDCVDGKGIFDPARIAQVVTNLLSNAIKFTAANIPIVITITTASSDINNTNHDSILFSIRDHGHGIPEGEFDLIFNRFEQSSMTQFHAGGTGLGLAICKEIINAHSGKIWVKNHSESGAVFSFMIPI